MTKKKTFKFSFEVVGYFHEADREKALKKFINLLETINNTSISSHNSNHVYKYHAKIIKEILDEYDLLND